MVENPLAEAKISGMDFNVLLEGEQEFLVRSYMETHSALHPRMIISSLVFA